MSKPVTQTFRINQEGYEALVEEARNQNLSQTALLNQILTRYARNDRFVIRNRVMEIEPRSVLTTILEYISEDDMEEAGRRVGETHPKDVLTVLGFPIDSSSFLPLLEILANYGFWCILERPHKDAGASYHLRNDLGKKWTKFLRGYVESAARKILGLSITTDMTPFTLTIKVRT